MIFTDNELLKYYRLKSIIRYNTRPHLKNESVAEHTFYVILLSLILADKYKVNKEEVLIKALLHDMPEIETNDITHDAKEKMNLREFLEKYELDYYKREFPKYLDLMSNKNLKLNLIVDLADAYSVYQYTLNEIQLGNSSNDIKEIFEETKKRIAIIEGELN